MFEGLTKKYIKEELYTNFSDNEKSILECLEFHLHEYIKDENELRRSMVFIRGLIRMECAYHDIINQELYELSNKVENNNQSKTLNSGLFEESEFKYLETYKDYTILKASLNPHNSEYVIEERGFDTRWTSLKSCKKYINGLKKEGK